MMNAFIRRMPHLVSIVTLVLGLDVHAEAQEIYTGKYGQRSGEELYKGICQGCHMPDAKGAVGAGSYPALANDPRLAAAIYPITVVINGQRAMPSFGRVVPPFFGGALTDTQIANVLNYVRTHFGNQYQDVITVETVKAARRQAGTGPLATDGAGKDKASASH
jgi:mono/diheme cytochrome c family protein